MRKSGLAFHCHHNTLAEYVSDFDERIDDIVQNKPVNEQALRLRLFKLVPTDRLPPELAKATEVYDKAYEVCDKASEAYIKAYEAYSKAMEAHNKAREAHNKAMEAHNKAKEAHNKARERFAPELERLHAELCPNCPFDNKTIFANEEVK